MRFRALVLSLMGGGGMGLVGGSVVGHPFLGILLGVILVYGVSMGMAHQAGRAASLFYGGSGSSAPPKTGYSYAEALVAKGAAREALTAYEVALVEDPSEPEPYLRIARLLRDELQDPEEAVRWFRRARAEATLSSGQDIRALREIAEVFLHHLPDPRRAAPELARLAEEYPETPDGQWATRELTDIKEEMTLDP